MGRQLTVRMPDKLAERLERMAQGLSRSRSDVVRLALERFFEELELAGAEAEVEASRPIERVRDLLGAVESKVSDLGQRHREHLLEKLRRAHADAQAPAGK